MRILVLAVALVLVTSGLSAAQPSETVTLGFRNLPFSLEPHVLELNASLVNGNIFDKLVQRSVRGDLEPALATSWKSVSDTVLEFKLRHDVKFHNGDALTPDDVKYSFERALDSAKKLTSGGQLHGIKTVQIVDADTVRVITEKPFPALIGLLAGLAIVPGKYVEKVGDQAFAAAPIGTGPWRFVEWKRDQYIRLEAFDQHWRGKPPFRHLVVRSLPDVSTRMAELKTGGLTSCGGRPSISSRSSSGSRTCTSARCRARACITSRSTCACRRSTISSSGRQRTTPSTSRR